MNQLTTGKAIVIKTDNTVNTVDANGLEELRVLVKGWIETVRPFSLERPYVMIVNEEGLITGLPINLCGTILYGGGQIVGDVVIIKEVMTDEGPDLSYLSDEEANEIAGRFKQGEDHIELRLNKRLV